MNKPMLAMLMAGAVSVGGCTTYEGDRDTLASVGTGAGIGAVAGAGAGAVIGGLSPIEGAVIGAAIGGIAGAVWADSDNDGYADGYYQNGRYYEGRPPAPAPAYQAPVRSGERG